MARGEMNYKEAIAEIIDGIVKAYSFNCVKETKNSKLFISPNMEHITPKTDYITLVFNTIVTKKKTTYSFIFYPGIYKDLKTKRNNYITYCKYYDNYDHPCRLVPAHEVLDFKRALEAYLELKDDAVKFKNMLKEDYAQN